MMLNKQRIENSRNFPDVVRVELVKAVCNFDA